MSVRMAPGAALGTLLASGLLTIGAVALTAAPAHAHNTLQSTSPAADSAVGAAPAKVDPETLSIRSRPARAIRFRKGAIIGANAVLIPGVRIGARALVGAGSVVTKDVEPGAIVAGNPARVLNRIENIEFYK